MNVLVLNSGSSSLKFQMIRTGRDRFDRDADCRLARGRIERIGSDALVELQPEGKAPTEFEEDLPDHRAALERSLDWIASEGSGIDAIRSLRDIDAAGHRVVHGGERFTSSVRIDDEVLRGIEECVGLAPLHNPANLKGIRAVSEALGAALPQVAVFDTAFHATLPEASYLYGIPYELYLRSGIRRYGFHGTSHRYVAFRYRSMHGLERNRVNIVTLHLGNGCSACAIKNGTSFDTSMGFTPLEGLLMGTRCGDLDPAVVVQCVEREGMRLEQVGEMLNRRSGLLGISGLTNDMRDLLDAEPGEPRARLAIEVFCHRVRKYVGAYHALLGGADAVVFTGGIGENSADIRSRICDGLSGIGIDLDEERNSRLRRGETAEVSRPGSDVKVLVIPTDEERLIARDTFRVVSESEVGGTDLPAGGGHREK
jgi:acetate kinase